MKPPHLRPPSIREAIAVIKREGRILDWRGRLHMAGSIFRAALRMGGVSQAEWERRMTACAACPIFDPSLFRCRPFDGSLHGCGCYAKALAMVKHPYPNGCWSDEYFPQLEVGWETSRKSSPDSADGISR